MKKSLALIALTSIALAACGGKETVIREVLVTAAPTTTVEVTVPPAPQKQNKYQEYLASLRDFSGKANSWSDADLIELADLVCANFDQGRSLDAVVGVFAENSESDSDTQLFAGVIGGAVQYICPEHKEMVQSQL